LSKLGTNEGDLGGSPQKPGSHERIEQGMASHRFESSQPMRLVLGETQVGDLGVLAANSLKPLSCAVAAARHELNGVFLGTNGRDGRIFECRSDKSRRIGRARTHPNGRRCLRAAQRPHAGRISFSSSSCALSRLSRSSALQPPREARSSRRAGKTSAGKPAACTWRAISFSRRDSTGRRLPRAGARSIV
jgi:hypothetical protein